MELYAVVLKKLLPKLGLYALAESLRSLRVHHLAHPEGGQRGVKQLKQLEVLLAARAKSHFYERCMTVE